MMNPGALQIPGSSIGGRLVADFENHVIEGINLLYDEAHKFVLASYQVPMLQRLNIIVADIVGALDIVAGKERRYRPTAPILCVEETDFDHDPACVRLRHEVLETPEIFGIPPVQVETVAASTVTLRLTP